jgi:hypothetical protein
VKAGTPGQWRGHRSASGEGKKNTPVVGPAREGIGDYRYPLNDRQPLPWPSVQAEKEQPGASKLI